MAERKDARTSLHLRRLVGLLDAVRAVMNQQVGRPSGKLHTVLEVLAKSYKTYNTSRHRLGPMHVRALTKAPVFGKFLTRPTKLFVKTMCFIAIRIQALKKMLII